MDALGTKSPACTVVSRTAGVPGRPSTDLGGCARMPAQLLSRRAQRSRSQHKNLGIQAVVERSFADDIGVTTVRSIPTTSVLALVLGGGSGQKLFPLTYRRSEPAISFGGAYRLIDVPLSNAINSGIHKVYVLTQYNSQSLNRHVTRAFKPATYRVDSFMEILAAQQTPSGTSWFQGTADAIRQFSWLLDDSKNRSVEHVVILAADQLYRMDYMRLVEHHVLTDADVTVACTRCTEERAPQLGLLKFQPGAWRRVTDFAEKPNGARLEEMRFPEEQQGDVLEYGEEAGSSIGEPLESHEAPRPFMASMGIYVFRKSTLGHLLKETYSGASDLGRDILPGMVGKGMGVYAYEHTGYWEDVGSIKRLFEANLDIAADSNNFNLFDPKAPIYTSQRFLPPAKLDNCRISEAMIGNGSWLEECTVSHAVIGIRTRIGKGSLVQDAVVSGSDFYENEDVRQRILNAGRAPVGIGSGCTISNSIVDKNCRIGAGCVLVNKDGVQEADREEEGWYIRDGIVVVLKGTEIPAGTCI